MNRTHVVAVSIAGVLGVTGGTALALQHQAVPHKQSSANAAPATRSAAPSQKPTMSVTPTSQNTISGRDDSTYEPLLYAEPGVIHDGEKMIESASIIDPVGVGRAKGGYVLADTEPSSEGALLRFVSTTGDANDIARVDDVWDLNAQGDRIVGTDSKGKVTVWSLDGKAQQWKRPIPTRAKAVFVGDTVAIRVIGAPNTDDPGAGYRWNPATDKTTKTRILAWASQLATSPGGSYWLAGTRSPGGPEYGLECLTAGNTWLTKRKVEWRTCDWRIDDASAFSPDGTRIVVDPVDTEGFGPSRFGIIDLTDGPGNLLAQIDAPAGALRAVWGDGDHLYIFGANNSDPEYRSGGYIDRCDLKGECTKVAQTRGRAAPGSIA